MIYQSVSELLKPLYHIMNYAVPILILIFILYVFIIFFISLKMNIKKRTKRVKDTFVPFFSDEELKYVFEGQKKCDLKTP